MPNKKPVIQNVKKELQTAAEVTKAKGQQVKGAVKEALGKMTDNAKMKSEGTVEKVVGQAKEDAAKAKNAARDAREKAKK